MLPVIRILGFTLPTAPFFALLAFYVFSEVGARVLGRLAPDGQRAQWQVTYSNATLIAALAGLIGARLGYAARFYQLYLETPALLLSLRPGSLAILPGLLLGGSAGLFYLVRKQLPLTRLADATALGVCAGLAVLSMRNFLTGDDLGAATTMPWAWEQWAARRHPVQLYEFVLLTGVFVLLLWRAYTRARAGETFWSFIACYSGVELLLEGLRAASWTWSAGIRGVQVLALVALLAALYVLSFYGAAASGIAQTNEQSATLSGKGSV